MRYSARIRRKLYARARITLAVCKAYEKFIPPERRAHELFRVAGYFLENALPSKARIERASPVHAIAGPSNSSASNKHLLQMTRGPCRALVALPFTAPLVIRPHTRAVAPAMDAFYSGDRGGLMKRHDRGVGLLWANKSLSTGRSGRPTRLPSVSTERRLSVREARRRRGRG
jgi:hypothetical protein